ncbi:acyl transferase domain-containing protein [Streptomonospora nanhaiensis]|uniref:Acyl transferase domain-containing protein n=1 Tax=Streptomonospora nanhaiensis TaxID=1323731 RepID=A0A853BN13_9ACTN|nr:beta-ketoacyl synthase N-terminal-like domain-containing protein [Streptomonospora nanhaiensis]NYI96989.1 acyl transferase domain-containing protein [Streptomonospora nanhaiensis]
MSTCAPVPVVVTGIACRLPGGITTPRGFWEFMMGGRDAVAPIPAQRWKEMVTLLAEEDRPSKPWHAGTIEIDAFDHAFFGISAEEEAASASSVARCTRARRSGLVSARTIDV